jgi:leucyl aminopeptidase
MWEMKSDMAGAAAVISATIALAQLAPAVEITTYAAMAENLPSGTAYRPGDVIALRGGKTIEILNTDAEGRLVLGDAIARACEDNPDYLIETSTLTGAQITALGKRTAGVMGTPELTSLVTAAGERVGEPCWAMPLPEEVRASMESSIADLGQLAAGMDRSASMLQGGLFLRELVDEEVAWAHIDVAGPAYNTGGRYGYTPAGGTGVPVRTLIELVTSLGG